MTVSFHIMRAGDPFSLAFEQRLFFALEEAAERISAKLNLPDVDVVVAAAPQRVIPRLGVNGFAVSSNFVELFINPQHPTLEENLTERVGGILAHELHHTVRIRDRGYGATFGERLVSEGLAQCFEEEVGFETPFYGVELRGERLIEFAGRALAMVDRADLDFARWMFGRRGDAETPHQCGYSLGYAIVKGWLRLNWATASGAVAVPATDVVMAWRAGIIPWE